MLSNTHFYHRTTRKVVIAFGSIFNNLKLYRYNKAGTTEIERITVPLSYASKEKFYQRTTQDPELTKEVQMTLPRMSFEMTAITYDPLRKVSSFNKLFAVGSNTAFKTITSAPYNYDFNLYVYVRNIEDGAQIIEQILPYFSPDYTITVDLIGEQNLAVDIPIVLNSISNEVIDDGGPDELRMVTWTLNFSAKAYLYGPIVQDGSNKVIRKVHANTYYYADGGQKYKKMFLNNGTGTYKNGELVYEGRSLDGANVTAYVKNWDPVANAIILEDMSGIFDTNRTLKGAVSGASYNINTMDTVDYKLIHLEVTPNPSTANANDVFGFTETITEFF